MTPDHDAIDELLAGYVLRSLTGGDAAEVDRLLTDHVPGCDDCRATLGAFQALTGDLAISPAPLAPPETLLPRLQRELDGRRRRIVPAWNPARLVVAAAAVIVIVGIAGLAITQVGGGGSELLTQADLQTAIAVASRPDAQITDLGQTEEVTVPGMEETYVYGTGVSMPPAGSTYRLWAIGADGASYIGDFTPVNGVVVLEISIDPIAVERLWVTVEPAGSEPGSPGQPAWSAAG
ncbi:MAG TPA: anti-sigma factor [Actinomycetota bacterium]|nr:anti-sigma factor [Actinomycetota bacterium]